jgi:multidrug resistance efflux pump
MPPTSPSHSEPFAETPPTGEALERLQASLLERLLEAAGDACTAVEHWTPVVRAICEELRLPCAELRLRDGDRVHELGWEADEGDRAFWRRGVVQLLGEIGWQGRPSARLTDARTDGETVALIGHPLVDRGGSRVGAAVFVVPTGEPALAEEWLALLGATLVLATQLTAAATDRRGATGELDGGVEDLRPLQRRLVEAVRGATEDAAGIEEYLSALCERLSTALPSPGVAATLRTGDVEVTARHPESGEGVDFWNVPVQRALAEAARSSAPAVRLYSGRRSDTRIGVASLPLRVGEHRGALVAVLSCADEAHGRRWLALLESIASFVEQGVQVVRARASAPDHPGEGAAPHWGDVAAHQERLLEHVLELAHTGITRGEYLRDLLGLFAEATRSPYAALEVRSASEVFEEERRDEDARPDFWKPTVQGVLTDSLALRRPRARLYSGPSEAVQVAILSLPFRDPGSTFTGALSLVVPCRDSAHAAEWIALLNPVVVMAAQALAGGACGEAPPDPMADLVRAMGNASGYASLVELAFGITNNLRQKFAYEQVALGVLDGARLRIVSISGLDEVKHRSPGVQHIQSSMEECADLGRAIVSQSGDDWDGDEMADHRLHRQWHESTGGAAVFSVPLEAAGSVRAVISVRNSGARHFEADEVDEVRGLVEPYAGALDLVTRATRPLTDHARQSGRETLRSLAGPGFFKRKAVVALGLLAVLWFFAGSVPYRVSAPCTVVPAEQRHMTTSEDGVLASAHALAGDDVRRGDVLCVFRTDELELEAGRLAAELDVLRLEEARALAGDDATELELGRARVRRATADLAALSDRIERSVVRSPIDGVVVRGDLRERIGDTLRKGEPLYEVAPAEGWMIELDVPEGDVDELRAGQTGEFTSVARPDERHELVVRRVLPSAEERGGRSVFVVEADAGIPRDWMLSGMQGLARVDAGRRSPCRILFQPLVDFVRMNVLP